MPITAYLQAKEYRERFSTPANLLTTFPAFDLDDPRQLERSFGSNRSPFPRDLAAQPKVSDWFPDTPSAETISILVRTSESSASMYIHFRRNRQD